MNLSAIFIRRPVMTTLVMVGILLFGVIAYRALPVSDLPSVDYPTIVVSASLPGATPETMASAVATPLERQFSTIPGVSSMTSSATSTAPRRTLVGDRAGAAPAPARHAVPPVLPEGEPGRPADPVHRAHVGDAPVV